MHLYLDELDFQAKIALRAFGRAWVTSLEPNADLDSVWADLQTSLFAAIIVDRIIRPTGIRADPDGRYTQAEAKVEAERRAKTLRDLLGIPDDPTDGSPASILYVSPVRHPMEHIDERFDRLVLTGVTSISDRYVSGDGRCFQSFYGGSESGAANFRVFIPASGVLYFDGAGINMFGLDDHLLSLRGNIEEARIELDERLKEATSHLQQGRRGNIFGGQKYVDMLPADYRQRVEAFLAKRAEHGQPIKNSITFVDRPITPSGED